MIALFEIFAGAVALAEVPLPSYREALVSEAWRQSNELLEAGLPEQAAGSAQAFEDTVEPDGSLEYLIGLSWNVRREPTKAAAHYELALKLDPDLGEAWYDLGELQLAAGAFDEARASFERVTALVTTGSHAYLGPQRLAEVAAHQQDPHAFEKHLHEALKRGFSFRSIAGLENWRRFYADPTMQDSVTKMITVYGEETTLESLQ
jgi:tetratricopeptide (TPR) repeat protein